MRALHPHLERRWKVQLEEPATPFESPARRANGKSVLQKCHMVAIIRAYLSAAKAVGGLQEEIDYKFNPVMCYSLSSDESEEEQEDVNVIQNPIQMEEKVVNVIQNRRRGCKCNSKSHF